MIDTRLPEWLDLTGQQFDIIKAIHSLNSQGTKARPSKIIAEDARLKGSSKIQKSNFFSQLKSLRLRGFVKKEAGAVYSLDFKKLKEDLDAAKHSTEEELASLDEVIKDTEYEFDLMVSKSGGGKSVDYLEYEDMYDKITALTSHAESICITGIFPRILYAASPSLMHSPKAQRYAQALWEGSVKARDLEVIYLSHFDIDYLFDRLLYHYKSPDLVYDEIRIILKNARNLISSDASLKLYYQDSSYGLDMIVPCAKNLPDVFLMVRDKENLGVGSAYLRSPELSHKFRELFYEKCERATLLNGQKGGKVFSKLEKRLERIYKNKKKKAKS